MYVCVCNKITDGQIREACDDGARSIECLQNRLNVATRCGRCLDCAQRLLDDACAQQYGEQHQRAAA